MDPAAYAEWATLQHLMKERYPDLPFHEAYVNLLHDSFIKLPNECKERITPMLPHLLKLPTEVLESVASCYGQQELARFFRLVGITIDTITKLTSSTTDTKSSVSAEAVASSVRLAAENMARAADSTDRVVHRVHNIHVIGKSLVDQINYYIRWMQTVSAIQIAQGQKVIQALDVIGDHLGESNCITVSGSAGPDGFAQHVYDFVKEGIDNVEEAEKDKHRFFLYHPDTNWYGAFRRLIRQDPLPPTFCAKSDNLDTLCQYMQAIRTQCGQGIIFHLLIPSWYRITIKEPLHFPDSLQPFQVEGRKHRGKPLVQFNLPAAPSGLLHGVANVLDPNGWNAVANGVSVAVTGPAVGWGVNGACLALGMGLGTIIGGPFVAIPVWVGTAMPAMAITAPVLGETIHSALREEAPRILGSHERFGMTP